MFWCLPGLAVALLGALPLAAQEKADEAPVPPASIPYTAQHELRSSVVPRAYRVFVALPENYAHTDTTRYPVLYLLDANEAFPLAVGAYRYLRVADEVRDLIIVGIGYPVDFYRETLASRYADYTPSSDPAADSIWASLIARALGVEGSVAVRSGAAGSFLATIREDVVPLIERTYRTTGDRGLWGHSFGGTFGLHVLLTTPDLFTRYALHSPVVSWHGGELLGLEESYAEQHGDLPAKLFVSVGSEEGEGMVAGADTLAERLRGRRYPGLVIAQEIFRDETHMSSVPAAITRALRVLYPPSPEKR